MGVSLILKTLSNPYFVTMEKDAQAAAAKDNVHLTVAAGKQDGDTQTQITAVDNAISRGDKGILITTNGNAVNTALNQAKQAGLFVIALDTALTPPSVADITFATDNTQAGRLDGQYAAAALGGKRPSSPCSTCSTTRSSRSTSTVTTASSKAWASIPATPT